MIGKASRIPGCQRILKRLRAVRIHVGRAQGTRDELAVQQVWLQDVADTLDRLIQSGAKLPGAAAVEKRDALKARKRKQLDGFHADQRWMVECRGE